MTHASLFSGIGGFDLAAELVGWNNVFNCEIDPFCQKILKYHFPKSKQYEDIKTTCFKQYKGTIDVVSGGFPCQPFSVAGKRKGTEDNRHLWPEMLRAIREIEPTWVVAENVRGIISQERGMVFERVQADLESIGYEVQSFIIPACAVGAPHRRDRVWFIAHAVSHDAWRCGHGKKSIENGENQGKGIFFRNRTFVNFSNKRFVANTNRLLQFRNRYNFGENGSKIKLESSVCSNQWQNFPTKPPVCGGDDGLPAELDGITFPKWRRESIKAYGNAIVPQIAAVLFEIINKIKN